jgi:hypothetical protein
MTNIITQEETTKAFLKEFNDLLLKYDATFEVKDEWTGYSECGSDLHARIYIEGKWDNDGNPIQESTDIDLGDYLRPEKVD